MALRLYLKQEASFPLSISHFLFLDSSLTLFLLPTDSDKRLKLWHCSGLRTGQGFWGFFWFCFLIFFLISHPFYTHQCIHVNPNLPIHHTTTSTPLRFPHLVSIRFFLYFCVSVSALQTGSSVPFSRFHIYALIYSISFSLSDLLHCV